MVCLPIHNAASNVQSHQPNLDEFLNLKKFTCTHVTASLRCSRVCRGFSVGSVNKWPEPVPLFVLVSLQVHTKQDGRYKTRQGLLRWSSPSSHFHFPLSFLNLILTYSHQNEVHLFKLLPNDRDALFITRLSFIHTRCSKQSSSNRACCEETGSKTQGCRNERCPHSTSSPLRCVQRQVHWRYLASSQFSRCTRLSLYVI